MRWFASMFSHVLFMVCALWLSGCSQKENTADDLNSVYVAATRSGYQLIKDGEPFFVKGACVGDDHWAAFRAAGGNTIRIYDPVNLKVKLDRADSLGLMVAVDIPLPEYTESNNWYADPVNMEQTTREVSELVSQHKDHPALLFWILGNEILYPNLFNDRDFVDKFNSLISICHELDPNHPVTTTVGGMSRRTVLSLLGGSSELDFLSFNIFGSISSLPFRMLTIAPFYKAPFMITEWGINGPWEAREVTSWGAPIEKTSTKKSEQYSKRYSDIMQLDSTRILGGFLFFWGSVQQATPTWFSSFLPDGRTTQIVHETKKILGNSIEPYFGPKLGYILLEDEGAPSNIILSPGQEVEASIYNTSPDLSQLRVQWDIRPENWHRPPRATLDLETPGIIPTTFTYPSPRVVLFKTPKEEGPYRLYLYLTDKNGQAATANIPFYILNPENAQ